KIPRLDRLRDKSVPLRERFIREARAAASVRHPNVCPVHDVGEQDGVPYVVMAYVDGQTLADYLGARPLDDQRRAAEIAGQAAEGLAAIHAHGIVHRDLKPTNILLDTTGQVLVTDFGVARSAEDWGELTPEGGLVGTPGYMAPEQARG